MFVIAPFEKASTLDYATTEIAIPASIGNNVL
jgi:hypothetical protein